MMNIRFQKKKGAALAAAAVFASFVIFGGCSMGTAADNSVGGLKPAQTVPRRPCGKGGWPCRRRYHEQGGRP